jgi:tetratricopeptide (TPR) repeat protein
MLAAFMKWISRLLLFLAVAGCTAQAATTNRPLSAGSRFAFTAPHPNQLGTEAAMEEADTRALVARVIAEAEAFASTGSWDQAAAVVNRALDTFPAEPDLLIRGGHYYEKKGSYAVAEHYWRRLEEIQPTNAWARSCRGALMLRMGRTNEAEVILRSALALNAGEMVGRLHLACILVARGSNDAARTVLGHLNLLETGQAATWTRDDWPFFVGVLGDEGARALMASILSGGERPPPATRDHVNGMATDQMRDALDVLARSLWNGWQAMQRSDWTGAVQSLQSASAAGFNAPAGYQGMAFALLQSGDRDAALAMMERAVDRFPESAYAWLKFGQLCLDLGRFDDAARAFRRSLELEPGRDETVLGLAGALASSGRMDDAWRAAESIPAARRAEAAAWFNRPTPYAQALRRDRGYAAWLAADRATD